MNIFWSKKKVNRLSSAVLIALVLSCCIGFLIYENTDSAFSKGDFPAFYSAGVLYAQGQSAQIYNPTTLFETQRHFWPHQHKDSYLSFAYPPYVAALFSPLSVFEPGVAKIIFVIFLFILLIKTAQILSEICLCQNKRSFSIFVYLLSFAPLLSGIIGAQNTVVSMFLYTVILKYGASRDTKSSIISGLSVGLWFMKPHFALVVFLGFLIAKRWTVVLTALCVLLLYYVLGWSALGYDWPLHWYQAVSSFVEVEYLANQHQMVSLLGIAQAFSFIFGIPGTKIVAWVLSISIGLYVMRSFYKNSADLLKPLLLVGPALVLISPHTVYYDIGISLVPFVVLFRTDTDRGVWMALSCSVFAALAILAKNNLSFSPLILISVFTYTYLVWILGNSRKNNKLLKKPQTEFK